MSDHKRWKILLVFKYLSYI